MSDENKTLENEQETPETPETPETKPETKNKDVDVQELLVEVAKLKRQADKNASEAADWKKKFRATQSEKELADAEKAEKEAEKDARLEELERNNKIHDLTENYMDLGYSKELAKKAASASADNDNESLLKIQKEFQEAQKKEWEAEFYKNRPELKQGVGSGNTYTKEQFDKMSLVELTKLKRENEAEYNRLKSL